MTCGCRKPAEAENPAVAQVVVESPKPVTFGEWTELVGTTQAMHNHVALVTSRVDGVVLDILPRGKKTDVAEGDIVDSDQVVVQLDDRLARANYDKAVAAQQEQIEQQSLAQIAIDQALIEVNRLDELAKSGRNGAGPNLGPLTTPIERQRADLALKSARAQKAAADAKVHQADVDVKALDLQLSLYTIRPPISGRLSQVRVVRGQNVTAGTVIADVVDLEQVDVLCYASPRTAKDLRVGLAARFKKEGEEENPANGRVTFIAPQALAETGNFPVKVRFENDEGDLSSNMIVHIELLTKSESDRIAVPESALLEDQDPPKMIIVELREVNGVKALRATKLDVEIGARGSIKNGEESQRVVEIVKLSYPKEEGDNQKASEPDGQKEDKKKPIDIRSVRIVVEGAQGLEDGDIVNIKK